MFVMCFLVWVIYNGAVTPEICLIGLAVAGAIFAFSCKFMDYSVEKEKDTYRKAIRFLKYIWVLVTEIVKANYAVVHMILSDREELQPVLVHFHSDMQTPAGRAFLANAITLTPGTITVTLEEGDYVVHCLDENLAVGIDRSVFVEHLRELEKEE